MPDKLKPCPFCGDNSHIDVYETGQYYHVHCNECAASGSWKTGKEEAVSAWNKRQGEYHHDVLAMANELQQLREERDKVEDNKRSAKERVREANCSRRGEAWLKVKYKLLEWLS